MKFIAVILSVIFLALSFAPCADSMVETHPEKHLSSVRHGEHNHSHHSDFCSPLCVCNCCGTVVAQIEARAVFEIPSIEFGSAENTFFKQKLPADVYYPIWEPPKIV